MVSGLPALISILPEGIRAKMTSLNYLDGLLDQLLDLSAPSVDKPLPLPIMLEKALKDTGVFLEKHAALHTERLMVLFARYIIIYRLLYQGITKYSRDKKGFLKLVVLVQSTQTKPFLNPFLVSLILESFHLIVHPPKSFFESLDPLVSKAIHDEKKKRKVHTLMKTVIYQHIYTKNDYLEVQELYETEANKNSEYTYIDVVIAPPPRLNVIILSDFLAIPREVCSTFLTMVNKLKGVKHPHHELEYLLKHGFAVPVTKDFARYHRSTGTKKKELESVFKNIEAAKDCKAADNQELWFSPKRRLRLLQYNELFEIRTMNKVLGDYNRLQSDDVTYQNLYQIRWQHYFDCRGGGVPFTVPWHMVAVRSIDIPRPAEAMYDLRNLRQEEETILHGIVFSTRPIRLRGAHDIQVVSKVSKTSYPKPTFLKARTETFLNIITIIFHLVQDKLREKLRHQLEDKRGQSMHSRRIQCLPYYDVLPECQIEREMFAVHELSSVLPGKNPGDPGDLLRRTTRYIPRCAHQVYPWRKNSTMMMNFLRRYAYTDESGEMVCKSCGIAVSGIMLNIGVDLLEDDSFIITKFADNLLVQDSREFQMSRGLAEDLLRMLEQRISRALHLTRLMGGDKNAVLNRNQVIRELFELAVAYTPQSKSGVIQAPIIDQDLSVLKKEPGVFNSLMMYLLFVLLTDLSATEAIHVISANPKVCPPKVFSRNLKFFSGYEAPGGGTFGDDLPTLCLLITQACCLFYHYNIYIDEEKDKQRALKTMIVSQIELFQGLAQQANTSLVCKMLSARIKSMRTGLYSISLNTERQERGTKVGFRAPAREGRITKHYFKSFLPRLPPTPPTFVKIESHIRCAQTRQSTYIQPRVITAAPTPPKSIDKRRFSVEEEIRILTDDMSEVGKIRVFADKLGSMRPEPVDVSLDNTQKRPKDPLFDNRSTISFTIEGIRYVYECDRLYFLGHINNKKPHHYNGPIIYAVRIKSLRGRMNDIVQKKMPEPDVFEIASAMTPRYVGDAVHERVHDIVAKRVDPKHVDEGIQRLKTKNERIVIIKLHGVYDEFHRRLIKMCGQATLEQRKRSAHILGDICSLALLYIKVCPTKKKEILSLLDMLMPVPEAPNLLFTRLMKVQRYQKPIKTFEESIIIDDPMDKQDDEGDTSGAFDKLKDLDVERPLYDDDDD